MRTSKFIRLQKSILLEYIYDDTNLLSEFYNVLLDLRTRDTYYIAAEGSVTNNDIDKQLFLIDPLNNKWGIMEQLNYNFLQLKTYSPNLPVRHDTINIHLPISNTFDDNLGVHIRVYVFNYDNSKQVTLSSFFFDKTDITRNTELNLTSPPFMFGETLWGKYLSINIPAAQTIAQDRTSDNSAPTPSDINDVLTNGLGLSLTSPIFIDFQFIGSNQVINGITTYYVTDTSTGTLAQSPEFDNLAINIEESSDGDYFNIYGTYNASIDQFASFIATKSSQGTPYIIQYVLTLYEENLKGKTMTLDVMDTFNEPFVFRPIIKTSTTTAVIDVTLKIIDTSSLSQIIRNASYGMLPHQVNKYSSSLSRINLANANQIQIFNQKGSNINNNSSLGTDVIRSVQLNPIKIAYPVLSDRGTVVAKSDSVVYNKDIYYGLGKITIIIYPFDNIFKIIIAQSVDPSGSSAPLNQANSQIKLFDLTGFATVQLVFQNPSTSVTANILTESPENDFANGTVVFKIFQNQISDIRSIYQSGINLFYIIGTDTSNTSVIYSGLYVMYDDPNTVKQMNNNATTNGNSPQQQVQFVNNPDPTVNTAIVTRKLELINSQLSTAATPTKVSPLTLSPTALSNVSAAVQQALAQQKNNLA